MVLRAVGVAPDAIVGLIRLSHVPRGGGGGGVLKMLHFAVVAKEAGFALTFAVGIVSTDGIGSKTDRANGAAIGEGRASAALAGKAPQQVAARLVRHCFGRAGNDRKCGAILRRSAVGVGGGGDFIPQTVGGFVRHEGGGDAVAVQVAIADRKAVATRAEGSVFEPPVGPAPPSLLSRVGRTNPRGNKRCDLRQKCGGRGSAGE